MGIFSVSEFDGNGSLWVLLDDPRKMESLLLELVSGFRPQTPPWQGRQLS